MRFLLLFLAAALVFSAQAFRLYLKSGDYHLVREYQVQGDRVHFFSTERDQWEDMPTSLVDLAKTEHERNARQAHIAKEAREEDEEEAAEREQRREIASIPKDTGAYYKVGDQFKPLAIADYQIVTNKKRKTLQVLSPVPLVPGKASVVIKGDRSPFVVTDDRPSFFLRLEKQEQFGIVSLTPKKNLRVVENISTIPVAKEAVEDRKQMDTFQQELADGLFRVWPEKPLAPGEYALIEYATNDQPDDIELLIWDFAYQPQAK